MIETKVDVAGNLVVNSCRGVIGVEEIKSWLLGSGLLEPPGNTIWNFSDADLSRIASEDVLELTRFLISRVSRCGMHKTAVVVPDELSWGLVRIYQIVSETNEELHPVELFRKYSEAQAWIDQGN
jgi:hypothetical protein